MVKVSGSQISKSLAYSYHFIVSIRVKGLWVLDFWVLGFTVLRFWDIVVSRCFMHFLGKEEGHRLLHFEFKVSWVGICGRNLRETCHSSISWPKGFQSFTMFQDSWF